MHDRKTLTDSEIGVAASGEVDIICAGGVAWVAVVFVVFFNTVSNARGFYKYGLLSDIMHDQKTLTDSELRRWTRSDNVEMSLTK
jgi:hypothetical protein